MAFLDMPWYGGRQMVRHLQRQGVNIGRRRVRRLMAKMGLSPIYQRPRTSYSAPAPPDLPVSAVASGDQSAEPYVVRRHHLLPDSARLPVLGGNHGLSDPQGAGVAAIEYNANNLGASAFA